MVLTPFHRNPSSCRQRISSPTANQQLKSLRLTDAPGDPTAKATPLRRRRDSSLATVRLKRLSSGQRTEGQRQPPATQTHLVRPLRRRTTPTNSDSNASRAANATGSNTTSDSNASRPANATGNNANHQRLKRISSGQRDGEQRQPPATQTPLVQRMRRGTEPQSEFSIVSL